MTSDDIQNESLKGLIRFCHKNGSVTITCDMEDAIGTKDSEADLIDAWQSSLESLRNECQHYWGTLEEIKGQL
jgi:hypothetical protein